MCLKYKIYSSVFAGDTFPIGRPVLRGVPLLLNSLSRGCCLAAVVKLQIGFLRLFDFAHVERHSGLVAIRVITISVQSAVVTVLVNHWLVQVLVDKVELGRLFANVIFGNWHANQVNL